MLMGSAMGLNSEARQPHAVLDLPSRRWKAMKIERLLDLPVNEGPLRLLEVGTGSGGIAHYFATCAQRRYAVDAVDLHDNRLVSEGFRYTQVHDTQLPFQPESFDVVLTNHVIEHVGDAAAQLAHLREIRRVLKPGGSGYLAVPNRWMLVEPHFKLPFLSWLPHAWRSSYVRVTGKGERYDCEPLEMKQLECLFERAGLRYRNACIEALRATVDIEHERAVVSRVLRKIPDWTLRPFLPVIPTLIYRFWY
jgi:ubiquinone/menaquinone biosynthesis C-methylase UbiE